MLLTKLKITVCVAMVALLAGVGATGVAYRATAQEPRRARTEDAPPQTRQPQTDDLAALRLEIEALRRELRATREQVKALEAEVRGQKGRRTATEAEPRVRGVDGRRHTPEQEPRARDGERQTAREQPARERNAAEGPIADAEAALRKLRANPNDRQAVEVLERTLKQLKSRAPAQDRPER